MKSAAVVASKAHNSRRNTPLHHTAASLRHDSWRRTSRSTRAAARHATQARSQLEEADAATVALESRPLFGASVELRGWRAAGLQNKYAQSMRTGGLVRYPSARTRN